MSKFEEEWYMRFLCGYRNHLLYYINNKKFIEDFYYDGKVRGYK